jgi:hypothetical protein
MSNVIDRGGTEEENSWNAQSIRVPAQFTNPITGRVYQTEINMVDYMGKNSPYAHETNKNDPFFAEQTKVHVFPAITDNTKESMSIIAKHMIAECLQDGCQLNCMGYTTQYNYLAFRCKRNTLYKNTKNPNTPLAKRPRTNTCLPLIEEHRCRFRFGFVFRDGKWRFSTGSGIPTHVFHVRQVNGVTAKDDVVPTEPQSDSSDEEEEDINDPIKVSDKAMREACHMTKQQWASGKEYWQENAAKGQPSTQTFDFLWDEVCLACDDSYHATAVMQQQMIQVIQACRKARDQDPGSRRSNPNGATAQEAVTGSDDQNGSHNQESDNLL